MKTIIDEWETVVAPSPPQLKKVVVNPGETALLLLDIQTTNCNEKRPRCVEQLPAIQELLITEITPEKGEPVVQSGVDKFYQTELESILEKHAIKTVILVGTSAHGAVLHTATGAAARGYTVIVPVDGLSAGLAYCEQYTVWHLANAPGTKNTVVTRMDWITI
jgi:nicotinamidase-related amidase